MYYVRVFDKPNNRYYKSIIYCVMTVSGHQRQNVVLNPYTSCFELVGTWDKTKGASRILVETIRMDCGEWITYENAGLLKYKDYCKKNRKKDVIDWLWGYRDVCENFEFLSAVTHDQSVPVDKAGIAVRGLSDADDWNYILTQKDADDFMQLFVGFHDAMLDKLVYEEEQYTSRAVATFDNSIWFGIVEICFEKISVIRLNPWEENYSHDIYEASLIVKDETVFWADDYMEKEDLSYDGHYIKALSMKWRKIG